MSASPTRKLTRAPIARPAHVRPLSGERATSQPAYVAAMRALRVALALAPLGVAAACGVRTGGVPPPVQPQPATSASATSAMASSTARPTPPPIEPSSEPPPVAGGRKPTDPGAP